MKLKVDYDAAHSFTRQMLLEMLTTIEEVGDESDLDTWDAMQVVLAYMSTPSELAEYESREVNKDFVALVVKDTLKKLGISV
jgi:hypothetical protein